MKRYSYSIGVGITTHNRRPIALATVDKIRQLIPKNAKIVIVDDGSDIPFPNATFRFETAQGTPVAKNKCFELLDDCEHIFLFDDDTYPIKKGWTEKYIRAKVKHLIFNVYTRPTYNFKNLQVAHTPNGAMMYFHNDCLTTVGGADWRFKFWGGWHEQLSLRIFNAGLTPFPFCDVIGSGDYIENPYNKIQSATPHRNRTNRDANMKLKNETTLSADFVDYRKRDEPIKVYYSNPYNTEKNIGKGLNEFCSIVPDDAWICLQDGDMMYLTPDWGVQIEEVIRRHGNDYDMFGATTNRLSKMYQRDNEADFDVTDIVYHYEKAVRLRDINWGQVKEVPQLAGLLLLFRKSLWERIKFEENSIIFDTEISKRIRRSGGKLAVMKGLYVFHLYRIWDKENPRRAVEHLQ